MVACTASNYSSQFNKMDQGKSKLSAHDLLPDKETLQKTMIKVEKYQKDLRKGLENRNYVLLDELLTYFEKLDMPWKVLEQTRVGRDINDIRKALADDKPALSKRCRKLIKKWQPLRNIQSPTSDSSPQVDASVPVIKIDTQPSESDDKKNRKRKLVEVNGKKENESLLTPSISQTNIPTPVYEPKKARFERSESVISRSSSSSTVSSPSGNALNILASRRKNVQKTSALLTDIVVKDEVPKPDTPLSMKSNSPREVFTDDDSDEFHSRFSGNFVNNSKKVSPAIESVNKSKINIKTDVIRPNIPQMSQKKVTLEPVQQTKNLKTDNKNSLVNRRRSEASKQSQFVNGSSTSKSKTIKSQPVSSDFSWEKHCKVPSIDELQKKLERSQISSKTNVFEEGRVILLKDNHPFIAWPYLLNSRNIDFIA
uniref:TFIIS N-terminal domain-containing protein n=1 Tax=Parastrongyloides trichosuri TaxID=131310 RepID=A0A0N4ZC04_PARTI